MVCRIEILLPEPLRTRIDHARRGHLGVEVHVAVENLNARRTEDERSGNGGRLAYIDDRDMSLDEHPVRKRSLAIGR